MDGFKTCSICGINKQVNCFRNQSRQCKKCYSERRKKYDAEYKKINKNKIKIVNDDYNLKNRRKIKRYDEKRRYKNISNLSDNYVKNLIVKHNKLSMKNLYPNIIELKREQLLVYRKLVELRKNNEDIADIRALNDTYLALINVLIHDIEKDIETRTT